MDISFIFDRHVTQREFIGRKDEAARLAEMLSAGENISIYEPAKTGKASLIHQALFSMTLQDKKFISISIDLFNLRDREDFINKFKTAIAHKTKMQVSDMDDICDIKEVFELPYRLADKSGMRVIVIMDEFQNIDRCEDYERILKTLELVFGGHEGGHCNYILSGSKVNAMKEIFERRKFFYRQVRHLALARIGEREILEHLRKGFLLEGKEIQKEHALMIYRMFHGNIWYINHLASICRSRSKGYINEGIIMDSLQSMISVHEPHFKAMMNDLTGYQIQFLKAVLDGVPKFSAADVIEKYAFNSSANVKRLKDALTKKEIISFNEKEEAYLLDPLFEYWIRQYYFAI